MSTPNLKTPPSALRWRSAVRRQIWLRGKDLNLRPSGYEPDELPDCSTPQPFPLIEGAAFSSKRDCFANPVVASRKSANYARAQLDQRVRHHAEREHGQPVQREHRAHRESGGRTDRQI